MFLKIRIYIILKFGIIILNIKINTMNILEKIQENLSKVNFLTKKKITTFISIEDKISAVRNDNPSKFTGEYKKIYRHVTKVYRPKYSQLRLLSFFLLRRKKGWKRTVGDNIPLFKVYELYRKFIATKRSVYYKGCIVIFDEVHNRPRDKDEDEFNFTETNDT
jgi:hypothetical protein